MIENVSVDSAAMSALVQVSTLPAPTASQLKALPRR